MRALVQRVKQCSVTIEGKLNSTIGMGALVLLGVKNGDTVTDAEYLAERCAALRIFDDTNGTMNLSVKDVHGKVMVVSQFTLYGDTRKGNRPSYTVAASAERAESLYDHFTNHLRTLLGEQCVATGVFRAMMDVELINDGPVTLLIESKNEVANG
jgi:D-aminoacyl-tRNA deacylase